MEVTADAAGLKDRKRFHSDNSLLACYYDKSESKGISKIAFSLTADFGFEKGAGVNGFRAGVLYNHFKSD